jgi:CspA family cold shock protein
MQGKIKWFSKKKGYGFITQEDGTDVFVHISSLVGSRIPREEEPVSFDMGVGKTDHPAAVNVKLLTPGREDRGGHSKPSSKSHHRDKRHHSSKKKHGILRKILRFIFGR